ncbi:MAG TPA: hypothetical protein PLX85_08190 [Dehalococcoidia bacterium]|nr:hypothetical protein [Dehalococcoidia bacterium]
MRKWMAAPGLAACLALVALAAACGGEDRPKVDVIEDGGTSSASASGPGTAAPGEVSPKPAGAQQVDVVLREFALEPAVASVKAGEIYFLADNRGPADAHELVIVKTDLAPDKLPVEKGKVSESKVKVVDEIEAFAAKSQASKSVKLSAGTYVLLCNIVETDDGQTESHYELGMRAALRVE